MRLWILQMRQYMCRAKKTKFVGVTPKEMGFEKKGLADKITSSILDKKVLNVR